MRILYVSFLILILTSGVYLETCPPEEDLEPCSCQDLGNGETQIVCVERDLEKLKKPLKILFGKNDVIFHMSGFVIGTLPSNLFNGIGIKQLFIDHCELDSLAEDNQPGLLGLENSLEELRILDGFTEKNVPIKLKLGHLKKLKLLDLSYNVITELGDDWFSNGPSSLETLILSNNGILKLGSNAFAQLNNLKRLSMDVNRFGPIKRSMFPTTANKLKILELENNGLTDIPKDMFSGMPSISEISFLANGISTLDEDTWSPIWQQLDTVKLQENNMYCDQRLKWISKSKKRPVVYGNCFFPRQVGHLTLMEFFDKDD